MPAKKKVFVLDTSALIALRSNEPGADRVQTLMRSAEKGDCRLLVSFMTRMELLYLILRKEGQEAAWSALRLLDSLALEWDSCEPSILKAAAGLKAVGNLSVADSWIGATAIIREAVLVHRDPDFIPLKEIPQEVLDS
jgi:predicted nucleic acid-binding protein